MTTLGRELNDVRQALADLVDRWPRAKAASLDPEAQHLLAEADRLLGGIDELLEPRYETPGERAGGAARPSAASVSSHPASEPRRPRAAWPMTAARRRPPAGAANAGGGRDVAR